jgi:hypothetical protein
VGFVAKEMKRLMGKAIHHRNMIRDGDHILVAVAFCAMLPDLIDKPLYTLGLAPVNSSRLWGHTLILSLMFCLLCWRYWSSMWPWALSLLKRIGALKMVYEDSKPRFSSA